jgi:hypothetical protein
VVKIKQNTALQRQRETINIRPPGIRIHRYVFSGGVSHYMLYFLHAARKDYVVREVLSHHRT